MPRLKSVTDANGTKIYPITITRGVYDTDKNQRLDVTLANKADNTIMGASGSNHAPGLVPDTPSTAGTTKYLREDGTWQAPPNTTYSEATTSAAGLMSSSDKTKLNGIAVGATANTGTITKVGNTSSGDVTVSSSNNTASFGSAVTVGSVGGVDLKFTMPSNPDTWRPLGTGATDACAGNDSRLSNSRPASDVYSWAKAENKPSYAYSEISYEVNTTTANGVYTGAITIDGSKPLHVIAITGNVTVTLSLNPPAGHSTHVLFTSTAARTVTINHDSTSSVCPEAANVTLNVVANGYVEVDFLNANSKIYVRGV